jgi:nucleotide-binding universal stress UspA family protein
MKRTEVIDGAPQTPADGRYASRGAKRILIPLDLMRGTIAPLTFVQGLGAQAPICATLLHVVSLNVAIVERRVYQELCSEAQAALLKLARLFFGDEQETRVSVRIGRPHEQIIEEARSSGSELIILCGGKPDSWARLLALGTAERVVRSAPCPTLILPRKNLFEGNLSIPARGENATIPRPNSSREGRETDPSNRILSACASLRH